MRLRDVELGDVGAYVRMRCDPDMMADLGGPLPRQGIEDKVRRDVEDARADISWIKMIVPDGAEPSQVAGSVTLWSHGAGAGGEAGTGTGTGTGTAADRISEIGWMVLPEYQGRGLGKRAVGALLDAARRDGRWGLVHATPAVSNGPSNGICRALGFTLVGEQDTEFAGRLLRTHHWTLATTP